MQDTTTTHGDGKDRTGERRAQWGHWGICFYWQVAGAYAPSCIEGTLLFPRGSQGPQDGLLGSTTRQGYRDAVQAWQERGILPPGVRA